MDCFYKKVERIEKAKPTVRELVILHGDDWMTYAPDEFKNGGYETHPESKELARFWMMEKGLKARISYDDLVV